MAKIHFEKKKLGTQALMIACVLVLVLLCYLSLRQPVRFEEEKQKREMVVKERLMAIKTAEEAYREKHGTYTADFKELSRGKLLADSLRYIPYSQKKSFRLAATNFVGKNGKQIPLMECSAEYEDYLYGLDDNEIQNLTEQAINKGLFPGLKVGDITTPNNNDGNW